MKKISTSELIGCVFNGVTFLEDLGRVEHTTRTGRKTKENKGRFLCHCGKEFVTRAEFILKGRSKSCGCLYTRPIEGLVFTYLTVIERIESRKSAGGTLKSVARCLCRCGKEKITDVASLYQGKVKSCGCYNTELTIKRNTTHGMYYEEISKHWRGMKTRSNVRKRKGGSCDVYPPWKESLEVFTEWAKLSGWKSGLYLCRNGDKGDYEPDNCRWDTRENNMEEANAKFYNVITPEGDSLLVYNLKKYADTLGFQSKRLSGVACGSERQYKGYYVSHVEHPENFDYLNYRGKIIISNNYKADDLF